LFVGGVACREATTNNKWIWYVNGERVYKNDSTPENDVVITSFVEKG
jgi:hypothetical protein